jgi:hypothetical protein
LEQVHVRGIIRRGLRLELVAALSITLAVPSASFAAQSPSDQGLATHTALSVESHDHAGRTTANLAVTVTGDDGLPAGGTVTIRDNGRPLAGAALDNHGNAAFAIALPAGDHTLTASFNGDPTHRASVSPSAEVRGHASTTTPDFQVAVAPATLALTAGESGTVTTSITPENASALTAPMFVTLSCSALPDQASCVFNPENIEIAPNATAAITSSLVLLTQQQSMASVALHRNNKLDLALLLPGSLTLGGLAFALRRRRWLQRLSLIALVAFVSLLGTTACNARYDYYNHGPPVNPPTPAGTYTIEVTAQSSNGVTATTHTTTLALTVK